MLTWLPNRGLHVGVLSAIQKRSRQRQLLLTAVAAVVETENLTRVVDTAVFPPRLPRRKKRIRDIHRGMGGLWSQMVNVWPKLPDDMETEQYYKYFRMTKGRFDALYIQVEGN
jgi:hypothetical protein